MKQRFFRRLCSESGANAVEFALISTFIAFPLIFGAITAAWAWNTQQTLTHAAREGARYAATQPNPESDGWEDRVRAHTAEAAHGLSLDPDDDICVYYTEGGPYPEDPESGDEHCFADELNGIPRIQVRATTLAEVFTYFLPERWRDLLLASDAVSRHEGGFAEPTPSPSP